MTGNRRVWPVPLARPVAIDLIEQDRERLWAEAMELYRAGFAWWLPPNIEAIASEFQDAFMEGDTWDQRIADFLDKDFPLNKSGERAPFTLREVARGLGFGFQPGEPNCATKADEMRIARRLRRLGYHPDPHRRRQNGKLERPWIAVRK